VAESSVMGISVALYLHLKPKGRPIITDVRDDYSVSESDSEIFKRHIYQLMVAQNRSVRSCMSVGGIGVLRDRAFLWASMLHRESSKRTANQIF